MPDDNTRFFLSNPVATGFFISDPFNSPRSYANGRHEGVDLRAIKGGQAVDIVAAQRGVIERIRTGTTGYGNYVTIRHDWHDGTTWVSWYAHLSSINQALTVGQEVETGQRLGIAGTTGNSTGVHLHLTLQHLGYGLSGYVVPDVIDPTRFFADVTVPLIDEMSYLADITVPDGSTLEAGKPFIKTWRVRNTGTSAWIEGYMMEPVSDERMMGPESMALPPLEPGKTGEITLSLVAPTQPGRHRTTWKGRNARGRFFAFELYADILVSPVARRDDAIFISDVTIPDGTQVEARRQFLKTWRVRNIGDTTWSAGYAIVRADTIEAGIDQGGAAPIRLPFIRPGGTAELSVSFTAPNKPGPYRSTWRLLNAEGTPFGPELILSFVTVPLAGSVTDGAIYVADITVLNGTRMQPDYRFTKSWRIRNTGTSSWNNHYILSVVGGNRLGGPTSVPLPATEPGENADVSIELTAPPILGPHRSSWQPHTPDGQPFGDILYTEIVVVQPGTLDNALYESDVTHPNGTLVNAGELFTKTWRVSNTGTSAWVSGYALAFVGDRHMNGPDSVPLPATLPGETAEVSVALEAPLAPGIHRSTWRARNSEGQLFGDLLYIEIRVPISSTPGSPAIEDAQLEAHVTFPDGSEIVAGEKFTKTWTLRNTGSIPWGKGYELAFVGGTEMGAGGPIPVGAVAAQALVNVSVDLTAPSTEGRHIGRWRVRNARGEFFGSTIFVAVVVVEKPTKFDMLPYLRGDGRLYEMKHVFEMPNGPLIGQQRLQTQFEGDRFYIVKNSEWEELWADNRFIYRGSDTSPGSGNFYTLMDGERYGTAWIPRRMAVGQRYRRSVNVVSRRKGNCVMNSHLSGRHVTWIILEAMYHTFTLPDVEGRLKRGIEVRDVVVLAAYNEVGGRPAEKPFERYYYAKGYGMVMWEGIETDHKGISFLVQSHMPGDRPDNVRERIPCLESLRP
jgi:hypothetical protein